jgi:peptidoglycan/LPS O-acetylase OafA/YrhL
MLGLALAEHYFGRLRRPAIVRPGWIGAAVVAGAGLLFLHPSVRLSLAGNAFRGTDVIIDPLFGIGFALVVLAATERERRRRPDLVVRAFAVIGLFSYSLYLMHLPLLAFGRVALRHLTTAPMPLWVGTWVIVLAGAGLLYVTVERHFIRGRPSTAPLRRMILRAERTAPYEAS